MSCKWFKDYCEPEIGLTEYCRRLHRRMLCMGIKEDCIDPENYYEEYEEE